MTEIKVIMQDASIARIVNLF